MSNSNQTHDHRVIKDWAEQRQAVPAKIKGTGSGSDEGILRIHFPKHSKSNADFEEISWEDFFQEFDEQKLDFLYQDKTKEGETSTFHKFIKRD